MAKRSKSGGLSSLSIQALQKEIAKRQQKASGLLRKRKALEARLAALDAKIAAAGLSAGPTGGGGGGGRGGKRGGGRRRNAEGGLAGALNKVLQGHTMGVTEVAEAVKKAGYKTGAANFRTIVNACLIKHKDLFKKVSRGQYTAA